MNLLLVPPDASTIHESFGSFSDFDFYTTTDEFTTLVSDSGTVAVSDAVGGIVTVTPSDGTVADNDEGYIKGTKEIFKFADGKPILFEARLQFTEANTDDANVIAGMWNAVAANDLADNGAGVRANFYGFAIYKVDGGTKWKFTSSMGTTQSTNTSSLTAGGSSYQKVRVTVECPTSTEVVITPYVDDVKLIDGTTGLAISHRLTISSSTEMQLCAGVKNGDTNLETLLVDYLGAWQRR